MIGETRGRISKHANFESSQREDKETKYLAEFLISFINSILPEKTFI